MCTHPKRAKRQMTLRYQPFDSHVSNRKSNIPNKQDMLIRAAMITIIFFLFIIFCKI